MRDGDGTEALHLLVAQNARLPEERKEVPVAEDAHERRTRLVLRCVAAGEQLAGAQRRELTAHDTQVLVVEPGAVLDRERLGEESGARRRREAVRGLR